ncbi:MAG: hypothetical protein JWP91_3870 [Fibrobacteres bacterium]|nr:hypothetical protein [Fibrobacterota bacterium]
MERGTWDSLGVYRRQNAGGPLGMGGMLTTVKVHAAKRRPTPGNRPFAGRNRFRPCNPALADVFFGNPIPFPVPVFRFHQSRPARTPAAEMTAWIVLLALLAVNAFYVAAEFASVSLPKSRLKPLAENGNRAAQSLLRHLGDPHSLDRYIAACQVGITWSSLVLGAYGQAAFAPGLSWRLQSAFSWQPHTAVTVSVTAILVLLTVTQMILGELVPKSLALHDPLRAAMLTIQPMRWSLFGYSWFISFLNGSGGLILRLLGRKSSGHGHVHSPKEIGLLLSESEKGGLLATEDETRLQGALKLTTRPVSQLMTPRLMLRGLSADATPQELLDKVTEAPFTRLPVFGDGMDRVSGIILAKEAIKFYLDHDRPPSIAEIMHPALFVPENMTADKLYRFLMEHSVHIVMVVDEFGSVAGLVTLDDLVAEMLGDMPDEFKRGEQGPETLPDGRVRVYGYMRVDEVGALLGSPWKGEASTVGGMVLELLGHLPAAGETAKMGAAEIEVEAVEGNKVVSLLVKRGSDLA